MMGVVQRADLRGGVGSAMEALQKMQSYLESRPKTFPTVEAGIEWQYVLLSCLQPIVVS